MLLDKNLELLYEHIPGKKQKDREIQNMLTLNFSELYTLKLAEEREKLSQYLCSFQSSII